MSNRFHRVLLHQLLSDIGGLVKASRVTPFTFWKVEKALEGGEGLGRWRRPWKVVQSWTHGRLAPSLQDPRVLFHGWSCSRRVSQPEFHEVSSQNPPLTLILEPPSPREEPSRPPPASLSARSHLVGPKRGGRPEEAGTIKTTHPLLPPLRAARAGSCFPHLSSSSSSVLLLFFPTKPSSSSRRGGFEEAMATWSPARSLQGEASCSICLGFFQEPVSIHCGHHFCRGCISRCWEGLEAPFSCPQCRETAPRKSFRPSRELAKIAEIARRLSLEEGGRGGGGGGGGGWEKVCRQHQEVLKLFCKEDLQPICVVCDRSRVHRFHPVVPVEEAAQEYKEEIQARLQALKEEREEFLESRKKGARKSSYLEKTKSQGEKVRWEFQQLRQFLKDQELLLLTQLEELEGAVARLQEEAVAKVAEEMSHLDTLIWEMEGKFQQPPGQFLQDIRRLLASCETMKFNPPVEISPQLERRLEELVERNLLVRSTLRKCQDSLMFKLQEPTEVTLDPSTAHPNLLLSEDGREARGQLRRRDLPANPERFDMEPCVLGRQAFTSGRHFWEVEVGPGGVWALGVARASVKRKGALSFTPKEGVWGLEAFHSLTSPRANLGLNPLPRRIRVSLDYEAGRVAFFGPEEEDVPILAYSRASFNGERLFPWFKVGMGARLQELGQTSPSEDQSTAAGQLVSPLDWVGFGFPLRICPGGVRP